MSQYIHSYAYGEYYVLRTLIILSVNYIFLWEVLTPYWTTGHWDTMLLTRRHSRHTILPMRPNFTALLAAATLGAFIGLWLR